jgi:hypothetical protein
MMYAVEMASDGMIHSIHNKFHEYLYRCSSNIKVMSQKFERLQHWYY